MNLFNEQEKKVWQQAAKELGATYVDHQYLRNSHIEYSYGDHTFYLDIKSPTLGTKEGLSTRMNFSFCNSQKLMLSYKPKNFKLPFKGVENIESHFKINCNDPHFMAGLLDQKEIRHLLMSFPHLRFYIFDVPGALIHGHKLPENFSLMEMKTPRILKDVARVKDYFRLATLLYDGLNGAH